MSRFQKQPTKRLGLWLWFLLLVFCMRVFGQLAVAAWNVSFLPPMEEWFSGLIPYAALLFVQFLILGVLAIVCLQFYRNEGRDARPLRKPHRSSQVKRCIGEARRRHILLCRSFPADAESKEECDAS